MIFRPIEYGYDEHTPQALGLLMESVLPITAAAQCEFAELTVGLDNYCLEDRAGIVAVGSLDPRLGDDVARIENVAVMPGRRGEGIGCFLIDCLEEAARQKRIGLVCLTSLKPAIKFYQSLGYESINNFNPFELGKIVT